VRIRDMSRYGAFWLGRLCCLLLFGQELLEQLPE
jgi:hypothetical protein